MRKLLLALILATVTTVLPAGEPAAPAWWVQRATPIANLYAQTAMSIVRVNWTGQRGKDEFQVDQMGLIVSKDGLIMTPGFLRRPAFTTIAITVYFSADESAKAVYIGKDADLDLAFIRTTIPDNEEIQPLDLSRTATLTPGDEVVTIQLLGSGYRFQPAAVRGYVCSTATSPFPHYVLDRPLPSYSTFAPLFTKSGALAGFAVPGTGIGVLSRASTGDFSLGIPTQVILPLIQNPPVEKEERGRQQGWLGVVMQAQTPELAKFWKLEKPYGVIVSQVLEDSPAAKAGVRTGDIIITFNNEPVEVTREEDLASFTKMVKNTPVGQAVPMEVYRDKKPMTLQLTLGPRPTDQLFQRQYDNPFFGLSAKELDVSDRVSLGLPETVRGVLIIRVTEGSWSELAELTPGDIVTRMDNKPVATLADFERLLTAAAAGKPERMLLLVRRGIQTVFIAIKPQWDIVQDEDGAAAPFEPAQEAAQ